MCFSLCLTATRWAEGLQQLLLIIKKSTVWCAPLAACQLILTDSKGEHAFSSGNIIRLEAADNYTIVYFRGNRRPFTVSKVLKVYEELLGPYGFVRTHRSHLVNKHFVKQIESNTIIMQDASIAPITHRKRKVCIRQLQTA